MKNTYPDFQVIFKRSAAGGGLSDKLVVKVAEDFRGSAQDLAYALKVVRNTLNGKLSSFEGVLDPTWFLPTLFMPTLTGIWTYVPGSFIYVQLNSIPIEITLESNTTLLTMP